jgi:hypothetical protein
MISPQVSVYSDLYILGLYGDRAALMISPQVSVYSDLYILGLYGDRDHIVLVCTNQNKERPVEIS